VRLRAGHSSGGSHVLAGNRVPEHRLEVLHRLPLGVADDSSAVEAGVDIGRDEAKSVAHHLVSGLRTSRPGSGMPRNACSTLCVPPLNKGWRRSG